MAAFSSHRRETTAASTAGDANACTPPPLLPRSVRSQPELKEKSSSYGSALISSSYPLRNGPSRKTERISSSHVTCTSVLKEGAPANAGLGLRRSTQRASIQLVGPSHVDQRRSASQSSIAAT